MFGRKIQRTAAAISAAGKAPFNPYKALKPWPPDFTRLDLKYQFRLERRYRRRAKLKYNRPGWIKGVKLAQWGICLCEYLYPCPVVCRLLIHLSAVFVYGVLFMDVGENENPFTGVRHCRYSHWPQLIISRFVNGLGFNPAPYGLLSQHHNQIQHPTMLHCKPPPVTQPCYLEILSLFFAMGSVVGFRLPHTSPIFEP